MSGCTTASQSASAATSTHPTGEWKTACDASGPRRSRPISSPNSRLSASLNDDSNPVGAVHLGLVYVAHADGRPVAIRERDKLEGRWAQIAAVEEIAESLETWSALLFDFLAR